MIRKQKNLVGQVVKKIRLSKKVSMTQEQLAIRLQLLDWFIDRFGVSKIERGEREITDIELLKLAKALDVNVQDLYPND
jgi:transcriptional regulator with XRE-family HTH domain